MMPPRTTECRDCGEPAYWMTLWDFIDSMDIVPVFTWEQYAYLLEPGERIWTCYGCASWGLV